MQASGRLLSLDNSGFARCRAALPKPPFLAKQSPPLMISPATAELEITRRKALAGEAMPLDDRKRRHVVGLDVRLEPVEPKLTEGTRNDSTQARAHETSPHIGLECVVPEVTALEGTSHDFIDVDDPNERVILDADDEMPFVRRSADALEPLIERLPIPGWTREVPMDPPASGDRGEKLVSPTRRRPFQAYVAQQFEALRVTAQRIGAQRCQLQRLEGSAHPRPTGQEQARDCPGEEDTPRTCAGETARRDPFRRVYRARQHARSPKNEVM